MPMLHDAERPELLDFKDARGRARISSLRREKFVTVVDEIEEQKRELFFVDHPDALGVPSVASAGSRGSFAGGPEEGKWAYLPWKRALVHVLDKGDFRRLRTSRNLNLITPEEQKMFGRARIGIAGLNVGNPAAICLALEGGGSAMKFADHDGLSVSNLNRFRAGIAELGINKAIISARQAYEIDPYAAIEVYADGVSAATIDRFLTRPRIDVLVEEMDNLPLKVLIRERARAARIPVVMVTGSGPDVVIDVERYDLNPRLPLMNGYLPRRVLEQIRSGALKDMPFRQRIALARDFMGKEFLHPRLVKSFPLVGKSLAGIPQLAESSFLRGAAVAHAARMIVTGKKLASGRYFLKLDGLRKS